MADEAIKGDVELILHAMKGDEAATELVLLLAELSHIWDDLADGDKKVSPEQVNRAFWISLVAIPRNRFYVRFVNELQPLIANSILNWELANTYEKTGGEQELEMANVLRYSIADVACYMVFLIGGKTWAAEVCPALRKASQKDTLQHYMEEARAKHVS